MIIRIGAERESFCEESLSTKRLRPQYESLRLNDNDVTFAIASRISFFARPLNFFLISRQSSVFKVVTYLSWIR